MSTEVRMPQLGESIAEGTIVKWFKSVGEFVKRDEPLFEITTDKVDTEVPAPGDGYVTRILVPEGETVAINTPVCLLGDRKIAPGGDASPQSAMTQAATTQSATAGSSEPAPAADAPRAAGSREERATTVAGAPSRRARLRTRSSPLVRRVAAEHGIDLSRVSGTGVDGRVTRDDLERFLRERSTSVASTSGRLEPMSRMRKRIAEHMVMSRRTSAHVTTVFEVDMSRVRERKTALAPGLLEKGTRLTYLPFIVVAVRDALEALPIVNSSVEEGGIRYHDEINIGIAVALDDGLIVPVVKNTKAASLEALAGDIQDLATRAREKTLKPEEVQGGTFTVTNPGVFGALIGTPIINQPQVAILCVGKIEKRPVVVTDSRGEDTIAVRTMCYLSLSYDHRVIDGRTADEFLARVKRSLETDGHD